MPQAHAKTAMAAATSAWLPWLPTAKLPAPEALVALGLLEGAVGLALLTDEEATETDEALTGTVLKRSELVEEAAGGITVFGAAAVAAPVAATGAAEPPPPTTAGEAGIWELGV